jgi:hypothetical protein
MTNHPMLATAVDTALIALRGFLTEALNGVQPKRPPTPPGHLLFGRSRTYRRAREESKTLNRLIDIIRTSTLKSHSAADPPFPIPSVHVAANNLDIFKVDGALPDWAIPPAEATQSQWMNFVVALTAHRDDARLRGSKEMAALRTHNAARWDQASHKWFNQGRVYLRLFMRQVRSAVHLRADCHGAYTADHRWTFDPAEVLTCKTREAQEWHGLPCERRPSRPDQATAEADPNLRDLLRQLGPKSGTSAAMWAPVTAPIRPHHLASAYAGLAKSKAPGSSRLRLSAYFHAGEDVTTLLAKVYDIALSEAVCPPSWLFRLIVHIPKSDILSEVLAGAVRPISLLETDQRFFYRIINQRVMDVVRCHPGAIVNDLQACLPESGCMGPLHTLVNIIYVFVHTRSPLYILYTDLRRAFDSVEVWAIRLSCERVSMPPPSSRPSS